MTAACRAAPASPLVPIGELTDRRLIEAMLDTCSPAHDGSAPASTAPAQPTTRALAPASCGGRPLRPVPADFIDRWPQVGWEGAADEWGTHARVICRWVEECGREWMVARRAAYLRRERSLRDRERRKTYRTAR